VKATLNKATAWESVAILVAIIACGLHGKINSSSTVRACGDFGGQ
jgi:hypothetical protein